GEQTVPGVQLITEGDVVNRHPGIDAGDENRLHAIAHKAIFTQLPGKHGVEIDQRDLLVVAAQSLEIQSQGAFHVGVFCQVPLQFAVASDAASNEVGRVGEVHKHLTQVGEQFIELQCGNLHSGFADARGQCVICSDLQQGDTCHPQHAIYAEQVLGQ